MHLNLFKYQTTVTERLKLNKNKNKNFHEAGITDLICIYYIYTVYIYIALI